MELKEFITATLTDIIGGVIAARKETGDALIGINYDYGGYACVSTDKKNIFQNVEFEVILTDKMSAGDSKGIGVSFGNFGAGYKKEKGDENASCTMVRFTIPIVYPG